MSTFQINSVGDGVLDGDVSELWFDSDSGEWRLFCFMQTQPFTWVLSHRTGRPWRTLGKYASGQQIVFDDGTVATRVGYGGDLWQFFLPDGKILKARRAGVSAVGGNTIATAKWHFADGRKNPPEPIVFLP